MMNSSSCLAQAALEMSTMPASARDAMGQRGRAYYLREFDREVLLERLENWMRELVAEKLAEKAA